jgi:hypothetical protein
MKPKKEWLRKPSHHPAIPREKAGYLPYSFLKALYMVKTAFMMI